MKVPNIVQLILAVMAVMAVTACAPAVRNPAAYGALSPPAPVQEYRIQAGDQLEVKFFYNPELNEQVIVRPDGRFSLQLANEIMAAGETPATLTELLRKKYATQIKNPEITVIVKSFNAQRVYVDGEVGRPGIVTLTDPMTVMQAISQAGGFKDTARMNEVIIMRRTADSTVASKVVNLEGAIDGSDTKQDIALLPYDVVYVPKSSVANVNLWIDQYIRKNIPLPIGLGLNVFGN